MVIMTAFAVSSPGMSEGEQCRRKKHYNQQSDSKKLFHKAFPFIIKYDYIKNKNTKKGDEMKISIEFMN